MIYSHEVFMLHASVNSIFSCILIKAGPYLLPLSWAGHRNSADTRSWGSTLARMSNYCFYFYFFNQSHFLFHSVFPPPRSSDIHCRVSLTSWLPIIEILLNWEAMYMFSNVKKSVLLAASGLLLTYIGNQTVCCLTVYYMSFMVILAEITFHSGFLAPSPFLSYFRYALYGWE